jgi:hypothetical protein
MPTTHVVNVGEHITAGLKESYRLPRHTDEPAVEGLIVAAGAHGFRLCLDDRRRILFVPWEGVRWLVVNDETERERDHE